MKQSFVECLGVHCHVLDLNFSCCLGSNELSHWTKCAALLLDQISRAQPVLKESGFRKLGIREPQDLLVSGFMCPALHMQRAIDCVYDEREVYHWPCDNKYFKDNFRVGVACYNKMGKILSVISVSTALKKPQNTSIKRTLPVCRWETA